MKMLTIFTLVAMFTFTQVYDGSAQEKSSLLPDARVRVWAPGFNSKHVTGTILTVVADTLRLGVADQTNPLLIPIASINKIEATKGKKSKIVTGAAVGFLVGAGIGAIIGVVGHTGECSDAPFGCMTMGQEVLIVGGVFSIPGLVLGTVIGAITKVDRWEELSLDRIRLESIPHE